MSEGCQKGGACGQTGNAALYSSIEEKGDEVMTSEPAPVAATLPEVKAGPDFSTFDIVKATQYGAFDRVRHLVQVEVPSTFTSYYTFLLHQTFLPWEGKWEYYSFKQDHVLTFEYLTVGILQFSVFKYCTNYHCSMFIFLIIWHTGVRREPA